MDLKPRLSGENSIIMSAAAAGFVVAVYSAHVGPVADVHSTAANDGNMAASVKKAGWAALAGVAALTLLAKDPNIAIVGGGMIIIEELAYRHALMADPGSGRIQVTPAAYQPAGGGNVTQIGGGSPDYGIEASAG